MRSKKSGVSAKGGTGSRKRYDDAFKVKVVLEALREVMTELASKHKVHPNQITTWKNQFLERSVDVFSRKSQDRLELEKLRREKDALVHQIGEQAVDIDFLKKNLRKLNLL